MKRAAGHPPPSSDPEVIRLAALFAGHPAWLEAARRIRTGSTSRVFFTHRPGEAWHLARTPEGSRLLRGHTDDPDFAFRFAPGAIVRLAGVEGGVGDFAAELFERVLSEDPSSRVDLRVIAPFHRLVVRGYLGLLLDAAPRLASLARTVGVANLRDLRRLVQARRGAAPAPWESETGDSED